MSLNGTPGKGGATSSTKGHSFEYVWTPKLSCDLVIEFKLHLKQSLVQCNLVPTMFS